MCLTQQSCGICRQQRNCCALLSCIINRVAALCQSHLRAAAFRQVNERGKVSSRTGPVSKKQLDKIKADGEAKKQQMQAQQQAVAEPPRVPGAPDAMPMRETPQVVVDRMLKRIFMFTGVPVGLGLALLPLFYYLKVSRPLQVWQGP